jgi:nicotinamidase-related amidase
MPSARRFESASPAIRSARVALLLIDVINPMDFPGADSLLEPAERAAERIRALKDRCADVGIPTIYVNDNYDCWHLGFQALVEELRAAEIPGRAIIERLEPDSSRDFYVLKPSHSGFYSTGLEVLLARLGARTLIMTGFAGDICVLFTANDGYMRGFDVVVPRDCIASESARSNEHALEQMERLLKATVAESGELDLRGLLEQRERRRAP